jgi:HSP20 family protein
MTLVKTNNNFGKSFDGLMNELFNEFPSALGKTFREDVWTFPPVNITEQSEVYQLQLSAPGFEKADFIVKLDANTLTISAEKKTESKTENEKIIRREFSQKSFKRSFTVDEKINAAGINAKYENGILYVSLPKKEEVKTAAKDITIQ